MGRNTPVLREIVEPLSPQLYLGEYALRTLETHFQHRLLVDVGNVATIRKHADQLWLQMAWQSSRSF